MKRLVVFLIAVGVGLLGFYGGIQYQKGQIITGRTGMMGQPTGRNVQTGVVNLRRMGNGQPVSGEILSIDETSLTVKLPDGSSRIVLITNKTVFNKTASVEKAELKVGEKVGVFGTTNADGSMSAQNVQLSPQFRMGGGENATGSAR